MKDREHHQDDGLGLVSLFTVVSITGAGDDDDYQSRTR